MSHNRSNPKALLVVLMAFSLGSIGTAVPAGQMRLWRKVDIASYLGTFVCLGDLTGDRRVDFLVYQEGPQTTPGFMAALDHDGKLLWELGDRTLAKHQPDGI